MYGLLWREREWLGRARYEVVRSGVFGSGTVRCAGVGFGTAR